MTVSDEAVEAALASKPFDDGDEVMQYILMRGLSAIGFKLPTAGSWDVMRAALLAASAHMPVPGWQPEWFLSMAFSARTRPDGRLEPDQKISGTGISFKCEAENPAVREMQRHWLEEYGRIERGAPFFWVDAPFHLDTPLPTAPLPQEG